MRLWTMLNEYLEETIWDKKVFGIDTYELKEYSEKSLRSIQSISGHFTLRLNPLEDKKLINQYGFYYADTLIEPYLRKEFFHKNLVSNYKINLSPDIEELIPICRDAFAYDRFHRDPNLKKEQSDDRYVNWLKEFSTKGKVMTTMSENETTAFFCNDKGRLLLHAVSDTFRGKGLAKYFWTEVIDHLFQLGFSEVSSSVSASNLSVLNLYSSLNFRFRNPKEIYRRYSPGR